ncbi:sigma-54 modulation protein, partial [Pseudomonas fluorescens BRIP34879]
FQAEDGIRDTSVTGVQTCALPNLDHHVEATVNVPGRTLHADASAQTMYAAIDLLADKLDRLIIKHKEKKQDHHAAEVRDNIV